MNTVIVTRHQCAADWLITRHLIPGKLIAHEWMHILLDVDTPGVDVVHKRGSGIGAEIVTEAIDLTDDDAEDAAKLLLVDRAFVKG